MTIEVPDWCIIGKYVKWKAPHITGNEWVEEKIISYGIDGFFINHIIAQYITLSFQNMEIEL